MQRNLLAAAVVVSRYRVIVAAVHREYRSEQLLSAQRHPVGWQGQASNHGLCYNVHRSPHPDSALCMSERALVCFVHASGIAIRSHGSTVSLNTKRKASTGATDVTTRSLSFSSIQLHRSFAFRSRALPDTGWHGLIQFRSVDSREMWAQSLWTGPPSLRSVSHARQRVWIWAHVHAGDGYFGEVA
jgi:hypothetical protein